MPLAVGQVLAPPPPAPPAPVDLARATWFAPDGTVWALTDVDAQWFTLDEVSGLGAAPILHTLDARPRGGAVVRHTQPQPRYITWPLYVEGASHGEFLANWRALARVFTQTRRLGAGRLRITRPDGTAREIDAFYDAGFDAEPGQGWRQDTPVLTLLCEDPYWRSIAVASVRRAFSAPVDYYSPYASISSGQVLGMTEISNPGDVEAWPVWTLTGPASLLTATSQTLGQEFELDPNFAGGGPLLLGQTVTITTDPLTVRGPGGAIWTGALNWPAAQVWPLAPGLNEVEFAVAGSGAGTSVELAWQTRHETA